MMSDFGYVTSLETVNLILADMNKFLNIILDEKKLMINFFNKIS